MEQGTRYTLSVWVRLAAGESATPARLSVERHTDGTASYDQVVGNTTVSRRRVDEPDRRLHPRRRTGTS